jgi:hypothetical protein
MKTKTLIRQAIATTILLGATSSAFALSCMKPDPVMQCKKMQESETTSPVFISGQMVLKKVISQEVKEMNIGGKGPALAEYHFTGSLSDKSGKRNVTNEKILVSTSCAGPWCARLPENNANGNFLLTTDTKKALKLHIGACSFQPSNLTDQQLKDIEACVTPEPVKPAVVENKGSSQRYSQRNKDKKLVK